MVEIQEILADAQESAKARRDRHTSEVGDSNANGLVPGSAHGLKASGVANSEGKGKGLDGPQRKSISPGARMIGQEIRGPEVRKTSSFDGREPRFVVHFFGGDRGGGVISLQLFTCMYLCLYVNMAFFWGRSHVFVLFTYVEST